MRLISAVHKQLGLLGNALDRYKAHVGAGNGFTDGCGIGSVVLAAFTAHALGHDEFGGHQAHGVAELGKFTGPMVRA
jgi:hypothetical protein